MQTEMKCPECRTEMQEDVKFGFWKCPHCGGEWWPDSGEYEEAKDRAQVERDRQQAEEDRKRLLNAVGKTFTIVNPLLDDRLKGKGVKGGSKNSRRKKKPAKKKLPWMLE